MVAAPELDLSQCDREPVHTPGAVLPHGALLVLDPVDLVVTAVSDNALALLGVAPTAALGRPLGELDVFRDPAALAASLRRSDLEAHNPLALELRVGGARFSALAHRHAGRLILECEPALPASDLAETHLYSRVRASLARLRATRSLEELSAEAAREMGELTGFDRVLVYAFRPDWSGEVVAEHPKAGEPLYLGLRFPASDIPSQARALYASCRLRMLPTASYAAAALLAAPGQGPIDLTHAALRSISKVHKEYMRNMGVTASLGISLIVEGQLWGLITCNHESGERFLPYSVRVAAGLLGELVSSLIGPKAQLRASEERVAYLDTQARLLQLVAQDRDVVRGLTEHAPSLLDVAASHGAAIAYGGELYGVGARPSASQLRELVSWVEGEESPLVALDSLPTRFPPARAWRDTACGLLAARIAFGPSDVIPEAAWLLWFRPEVAQTVSWGGDPNKPVEAPTGSGGRLRPRTSFELWREEVHLRSAPFKAAEIEAARSLAAALVDVALEIEASRKLKRNAALLEEAHGALLKQIETNRAAELELRRAHKLEAVGRLAAGVAHEINTPLQFVSDNLAFLQTSVETLVGLVAVQLALEPDNQAAEEADFAYLRDELPKAIAQSQEGLGRVSVIVRAMKAFAHPDSAEKTLEDINQAIATTVDIARSEVKEVARVVLDLAPLPRIPCYVGDLSQVFLNLIVNAAQAIKKTLGPTRRSGVITIASWHAPPDVFVTVADDGEGIPEAIRESVFVPFFTTKEVGQGTGQGLAIAHSIVVDKHGGSLTFESEVGRGTTFCLRLPTA
jgi:light-regulated signal transduction histidine kinase (bacteriophytochrome)